MTHMDLSVLFDMILGGKRHKPTPAHTHTHTD